MATALLLATILLTVTTSITTIKVPRKAEVDGANLREDIADGGEERSLAHTNCFGLDADVLVSGADSAATLIAMLQTAVGRRAAKEAALRTLLRNSTDERAVLLLQDLRGLAGLSVCGNAWLDWLPWLPCRVQSPPPRPDFHTEERVGFGEEPICRPTRSLQLLQPKFPVR